MVINTMTNQLMLSSFSKKTISVEEATKDFRQWNNVIFDWNVKYKGYFRGEDYEPEGYIDFSIVVRIVEALVKAKSQKSRKNVKLPGYKLVVSQNMVIAGKEWDACVVYDESFQKNEIKKTFDVFQRELMNIQGWIDIAESRTRLMPERKDIFECPFCGWVTDVWSDDIVCYGCGKRFWSEKSWGKFA